MVFLDYSGLKGGLFMFYTIEGGMVYEETDFYRTILCAEKKLRVSCPDELVVGQETIIEVEFLNWEGAPITDSQEVLVQVEGDDTQEVTLQLIDSKAEFAFVPQSTGVFILRATIPGITHDPAMLKVVADNG
jgi:hypothetical protein